MTVPEAKNIPLANLVARLGHQPAEARQGGNDVWYLSRHFGQRRLPASTSTRSATFGTTLAMATALGAILLLTYPFLYGQGRSLPIGFELAFKEKSN